MILIPKHTVLRPDGQLTTHTEWGDALERDILICRHCDYLWQVVPGSGRKRGWCTRCNGPLCAREIPLGSGRRPCMESCTPMPLRIERMETLREA